MGTGRDHIRNDGKIQLNANGKRLPHASKMDTSTTKPLPIASDRDMNTTRRHIYAPDRQSDPADGIYIPSMGN